MQQPAKQFEFLDYSLDRAESKIDLAYRIILKNGNSIDLHETISAPAATEAQWRAIPAGVLKNILETLHLACGMSYWKMHCAKKIIHPYYHDKRQAEFWTKLYTNGLGEFFYRNQIDFRDLIQFPIDEQVSPQKPQSFPRTDRALVPFGGGKDSIVTAELLKKANQDFILYTLGSSHIQAEGIEILGKPHYQIERRIDPQVFELNASGDVYNGHIPISSIYIFTGLLACLLKDANTLIFSNERSANIGNVEYLGLEINHQWSKSEEFERMAQTYIENYITKDVTFFSLLRPMYEIEVVRRFCRHEKYFEIFSSCNRNFKVKDPVLNQKKRWCGECPKCAFVYALLRAFITKQEAVTIFGKDLFEEEKLFDIFEELLGLKNSKPFECVGTPEETAFALHLALKQSPDDTSHVIQRFKQTIEAKTDEAYWQAQHQALFNLHEVNHLPTKYQTMLNE